MRLLLLAALAVAPLLAAQQTPAPQPQAAEPTADSAAAAADPVLTVEFSNPALSPSRWTLTLHPNGSGHFRSTMGPAATGMRGEMRVPDVNRDVQLSPQFSARAFEIAKRHDWFNQACESHLKVAFQGWKTLSYAGPAGKGSCTYNFSRDKEIQELGDSFLGVSETLLAGERLEMLLQHDPLGLEKEMESLTTAAQDGRAQQIYAIRDILQRLAGDDNVMEMVRKRARLLLARAES